MDMGGVIGLLSNFATIDYSIGGRCCEFNLIVRLAYCYVGFYGYFFVDIFLKG